MLEPWDRVEARRKSQLKMDESGPLRGDEDGVSSPEVMAARVSLGIFFSKGIFDPLIN